MRFVIAYLATGVVFLGLDAIWLSQVGLGLYRREIGALLLEQPNLPVAGLFYLLFVAGIVLLVVQPAAADGDWLAALWMGALLGLVAYGTYDITNLSTLRGWSPTIAAIDVAWGAALTAVASLAGFLAVSAFAAN
ncbi:MAG: DUF2177 family protein [Devosia sp.]